MTLLDEVAQVIADKATQTGLTIIMFDDPFGGGSSPSKPRPNRVAKQNALFNALQTKGANVIRVSAFQTTDFDRGVLITFDDDEWLKRQGIVNKLNKAGQIKWILDMFAQLDVDSESLRYNWELNSEQSITFNNKTIHLNLLKRTRVDV